MKLTPENKQILEYLKSDDSNNEIVLINSKAGTGKTTLAEKIVEELNPKNGIYTAFNKKVIEEGLGRFEGKMECKTLHALALKYVNPKLPIESFTYSCITENIGYKIKRKVIDSMDEFFRSSELDPEEFLNDYFKNDKLPRQVINSIKKLVIKYINLMVDDEVHPTFNYLLKWFHLLLVENKLSLSYDLLIFDECQDQTGVAIEIFKNIKCNKKVGLGDPHQGIYEFMNLVSAFDTLPEAKVFNLTQSFRCSVSIASKVEHFGKEYLDNDFSYIGTTTTTNDGLTAVITATNSAIIDTIIDRLDDNKSFTLTRPIKEICETATAVSMAASGKEVYSKKYKHLETEYKNWQKARKEGKVGNSFYTFLINEISDIEIKTAVNILMKLMKKGENLFTLIKTVENLKPDKTFVIGTAFSLKGSGFYNVYIQDDLNTLISTELEKIERNKDWSITPFRVYYVACTRARKNLYNAIHLE